MMIVTAKVHWKRCILVLIGVAAVICAALAIAGAAGKDSTDAFAAKNGKDDVSRVEYLNQLGWEVSSVPTTIEDILIPDELDDATYGKYLILQQEAGFDLERYCGKTVTRYTYAITNYPTGEDGMLAGLLVYKGKIIGGDVMSAAMDGFMHSLVYPAETDQS